MGNISGTITPDRNNGTVQKATLVGSITLNLPSNMTTGQSFTLIFTQDSNGLRTLTPDNSYKFASGYKTLSTIASAVDMLNIFYDGSIYYVTLTTGYS